MVTSAKTTAKPAAKTEVKKAAKPANAAPVAASKTPAKVAGSAKRVVPAEVEKPFLRFYHSSDLQARTHAVLSALEAAPELDGHGDALADLVAELTEAGMNDYYLRALKSAKVGFVAEQSARLAMSGAVKLISSVSRKFIVRMDSAQLLVVAEHIRKLAR